MLKNTLKQYKGTPESGLQKKKKRRKYLLEVEKYIVYKLNSTCMCLHMGCYPMSS